MSSDHPTPNGSQLCLECALCCDGSLFTKAHLRQEEQEAASSLKLRVHPNGEQFAFYLPCHLLENKACTIYEDPSRPHVCGGFKCKLLMRYLAGQVDLESALQTVQTARNLLTNLQQAAPFGNDQRVTFNNIRVMVAYLSNLSEAERAAYAPYIELVTEYIRLITRDFVFINQPKPDEIAETEMTSN